MVDTKKETKTEPSPELEALKTELAAKIATIDDYTDHLKRLQAEFDNYMKRVEKERVAVAHAATERMIVKLLLVVDDFERALNDLKLPSEARKGVDMIFKNLHKILDEEHVVPIESVGKTVDPYQHEVILKIESDQPEDLIIEEIQKGYAMNGKVIRYAKVAVSCGNGGKNNG